EDVHETDTSLESGVVPGRRDEAREHQAEAVAGVSSSRSARPVSAKNASARLGRTSAISRTSPPTRSAAARIAGTVAVSVTLTVVSGAEESASAAPAMPASHPGGS